MRARRLRNGAIANADTARADKSEDDHPPPSRPLRHSLGGWPTAARKKREK